MEGNMPHTEDYGVVKECKRQPAKQAPYAYQMKTMPSTWKVNGKVVASGSNLSGGNMNAGGKHRPGKKP